jgi:hypothetical protein
VYFLRTGKNSSTRNLQHRRCLDSWVWQYGQLVKRNKYPTAIRKAEVVRCRKLELDHSFRSRGLQTWLRIKAYLKINEY